MELEKEICQKSFSSEYAKATLNILFTASWLNARQMKLFKPHGLTSPQYNVLRILRGQHPGPATIGLISERMVDRTSNVSRIVDKLLDKGLIDRRTCKSDRRAVDIYITGKGLSLLEELDSSLPELERSSFALSRNEVRVLNSLLDKLRSI
jgi:DNA-binding MarR family transcriptional regulator